MWVFCVCFRLCVSIYMGSNLICGSKEDEAPPESLPIDLCTHFNTVHVTMSVNLTDHINDIFRSRKVRTSLHLIVDQMRYPNSVGILLKIVHDLKSKIMLHDTSRI